MITTHTDNVSRILIHTVIGTVSADEVVNHTLESVSENPTPLVLWDARAAHLADLSTKDLRNITWRTKGAGLKRDGGRTALLFSQPSGFGVGRMMEAMTECAGFAYEVRSFLDQETAKKWLLAWSQATEGI